MSKTTRTADDYMRFVVAWQSASSPLEAGKSCGLSASKACALASFLRKKGVNLKKFDVAPAPINVEELNRIAAEGAPRSGGDLATANALLALSHGALELRESVIARMRKALADALDLCATAASLIDDDESESRRAWRRRYDEMRAELSANGINVGRNRTGTREEEQELADNASEAEAAR